MPVASLERELESVPPTARALEDDPLRPFDGSDERKRLATQPRRERSVTRIHRNALVPSPSQSEATPNVGEATC